MATDTSECETRSARAESPTDVAQCATWSRVLQINKYHFIKGGAERYYFDVSRALARRGIEVDHLSMEHARNAPAGERDQFVPEVDYRGRMGIVTKIRAAARVIHNREAARRARTLAKNGPRAIAHLQNIYHHLSPSIIRELARQGVPMVQTLHDYKLVCPNYSLRTEGSVCERCRGGGYWQAVRHRCVMDSRGASVVAAAEAYWHQWIRTYDKIARFLCPSRFLLEKVASFGVPRERLIHLPNFLPLDDYHVGPPPTEESCVFVGRLSPEKGIATLIRAMGEIGDTRLRLRIVGEGPQRAELEALAQHVCPSRVEFLGFQSGHALHDLVRGAAFAVVPSEWYENFPYSILECFALGKPVVGARIGGIPELVVEGVTGKQHESGDVASLADALRWMTSADVVSMGANARERVEVEYSEDTHVDRLLAIYDEVAEQNT